MVVATSELARVNAGVRFTRPSRTTLLDGEHCSCHEMLPDMGSLLVADSNADGMVEWSLWAIKFLPLIYWANLFNYYLIDPGLDPELKGKALPIVRRSEAETSR